MSVKLAPSPKRSQKRQLHQSAPTPKRFQTLALRTLLFTLGGTLGMAGTSLLLKAFANDNANLQSDEPSPEQIQAEMTADSESIYSTHGQHLSPSREKAIEALRKEYQFFSKIGVTAATPAPSTGADQASYRVEVDVFKRPRNLGIDLEFMTVKLDGQLRDAFVISTARPGKYTIEGSYPVSIERRRGRTSTEYKPYPWHTSSTYQNSPMYWGLQLSGGYWTHSTPHYGDLGRPASMGCVRMTFPAAMELWSTIVNDVNGSAIVRIHGSGSASGSRAFAALGADSGWLLDRIQKDLSDAHAVTTGDYSGVGHSRVGEPLSYPSCEGVDCFEYFGKQKPASIN